MAASVDLKKMNKTLKIFAVAQFGLIAILIYTAINFQQRLQALNRGYRFMHGVIYSFGIQLLLFYPIFKFASREAERDFNWSGKTPNPEETKEFTKKKRWADVVKISVMGFYFIFALAAPGDPFILSVIIYSFLLTILTYLQCYSFAIKKLSKAA
jgi:hypothetical protein